MVGGSSLPNPQCVSTAVAVPPEWKAMAMTHSNRVFRLVLTLLKVSCMSFSVCHRLFLVDFLLCVSYGLSWKCCRNVADRSSR